MTINFFSGNTRYLLDKFQKPKTFDPETGHGAFLWAMFLLWASRPSKRDCEPDGSYFISEIDGARFTTSTHGTGDRVFNLHRNSTLMVQKNTAVSETVVKASGGYESRVLNKCNTPEDIRHFERPGMMTIKLWGIRYGHDMQCSFVNDLEDPTSPPCFLVT